MARNNFPLLAVATVTGDVFNKWAQLIQIQSTLDYPRINLSDSGFSVDAETPELALHELVSFQEECRHAQAECTVCFWLLAGCQLGDFPAPHSSATLPFSHCTLAVCSYDQVLHLSCVIRELELSRLSNPLRVWECIMRTWWLPAVFSLHFLCTNLLGNYIKSRNEIKNANFKVITYMWLQN